MTGVDQRRIVADYAIELLLFRGPITPEAVISKVKNQPSPDITAAANDLGLLLLEQIIIVHGDNPSADAAVRQLLLRPEPHLYALGSLDAADVACLLHCTVPVGEETIPMLPVFTRAEFLMRAVEINPEWSSLQINEVESRTVLDDLEEGEWLGINPWSEREFKLPPVSPPGELADQDAVADYREALHADPSNPVTHQGLGNALSELSRFAATFLSPAPGRGEASTWGPTMVRRRVRLCHNDRRLLH